MRVILVIPTLDFFDKINSYYVLHARFVFLHAWDLVLAKMLSKSRVGVRSTVMVYIILNIDTTSACLKDLSVRNRHNYVILYSLSEW